MLMNALHFRFNINIQVKGWFQLAFAMWNKNEIEEIHGISNAIND